jgi:hypothetical protein
MINFNKLLIPSIEIYLKTEERNQILEKMLKPKNW